MVGMRVSNLILVFLISCFRPCSSVKILPNQGTTLIQFKAVLGPLDSSVLSDWLLSNLECQNWTGIQCDENGKVTEIFLSGEEVLITSSGNRRANLNTSNSNPFNGTISPVVTNLDMLQYLTLASIGPVSGEIPSAIGNLKHLRLLNVSGNTLFGEIPPSLGSIPSFEVLDVHANQAIDAGGVVVSAINGTIPRSLLKTQLKFLDVSENLFTGSPPSFLKSQNSLSYLSLFKNSFVGNLSLFIPATPNLTYLNLGVNNFTGALDPVIGELTGLQFLGLNVNQFSGDVPGFIGNLKKLIHLDLGGNLFSGVVNNFGQLQSLQFLDLDSNLIEAPFPDTIGDLSNLQTLIVRKNGFSGYFNISQLAQLTYLDISFNRLQVSGGIPSYFGTFRHLQLLIMDSIQFGGGIPAAFGNILNLTSFSCAACGLNGTLAPSLGNLRGIQYLDLSRNNFAGPIPDSLCQLTNISHLDLSSNSLNGGIPSCLGATMPILYDLWLYNNSLTGSIPAAIATNPCATSIQLQINALVGPIPAFGSGGACLAYGGTPAYLSVSNIDLSNNSLSGQPFPPSITNLVALTSLSLSYNNFFSGEIPIAISNLTSLTSLLCRSCNLFGSIPVELQDLNSLQALDLSFNSFSGSLVPGFFSNFTAINILAISGSSLSAEIPSLQGLTQLSNLDLSFNQFHFSLPTALPSSLVSLNLGGNQLSATLSNSSFSLFPNLNILELEGNFQISGVIPVTSASIVSLGGTNLSGTIPPTYLNKSSSLASFYGTPACTAASQNNLSVCQPQLSTNQFTAGPVCTPSTPCFGTNLPSPFLLNTTGSCVCAGYVTLSLSLILSPFSVLTTTAASLLESQLAALVTSQGPVPIAPSMFWVQSAVTATDGRTAISVAFFGPGESRAPDTALSRLLSLWKPGLAASSPYLLVNGIGFLTAPLLTGFYEFVPPPSPPPPSVYISVTESSSSFPAWAIAVIVVAFFLLAAAAIPLLAIHALRWYVRVLYREDADNVIPMKPHYVPRVPFSEIQAATHDFSEENRLGAGGYGIVYRGVSVYGVQWAVKRAKIVNSKNFKDFETEVDTLSKVSHSNVVRLLGYCDTKNEQILIYEYMNAGTLKDRMKEAAEERLSLLERVEIACGAAEGLRYLHNHAEQTFIHRDIKSENILLSRTDLGYQSKISDFGLLKQNTENLGELLNTRLAGTAGYIDPEYINNFKVTRKSDVYSFGVVLLQLITGLPALIRDESVSDPEEHYVTSLASWVRPSMESAEKMVDPNLGSDYSKEAVEMLIRLAKKCTERFGKYRPLMEEVCFRLTEVKNVVLGVGDGAEVGEERPEEESRTNYSGSNQMFSDNSEFTSMAESVSDVASRI